MRRLDVDELVYDEAAYQALDPLPEVRRRQRRRVPLPVGRVPRVSQLAGV